MQIGNGKDFWGMLLVQWIGLIFFEEQNTNEIPFNVFWQLMEIHEETNPQNKNSTLVMVPLATISICCHPALGTKDIFTSTWSETLSYQAEVDERLKREGTYVYLWLIHEWEKPTHYSKVIILQLKINKLKNHSWITWKDGSWTTQVKKIVQKIFWSWSCKCGNNWQRLYTLTRKLWSTLNFEHLKIPCWKC